jgi:DNA-binding response OmpR family regulator
VILPSIDGFETCLRLRGADVWAPVLMLTARRALEDRVGGLDGGASHELRTPLAILRTELELALAKGRSPEEAARRAGLAFSRPPRASAPAAVASALSMVRTVARAHGGEAHGGEAQAANRDGGGADVWLALPLGVKRSVYPFR